MMIAAYTYQPPLTQPALPAPDKQRMLQHINLHKNALNTKHLSPLSDILL